MRAAATELNLTHGAVSRRVSKLAGDIGLELLEAHGRGLRLTADGEKLAQATSRALAVVSTTLDELRRTTAAQPVLVSCERSLAMRWLIPRLAEFQDRYPDVDLHLAVGGGAFDFTRDRVTLAIRRLDFAINSRCAITTLTREEMGPVMQVGMVERFWAGDYVALASKTRPDAWDNWERANGRAEATRHALHGSSFPHGRSRCRWPRCGDVPKDHRFGRHSQPTAGRPDGVHARRLRIRSHPVGVEAETPHALLFKTWLQTQVA